MSERKMEMRWRYREGRLGTSESIVKMKERTREGIEEN